MDSPPAVVTLAIYQNFNPTTPRPHPFSSRDPPQLLQTSYYRLLPHRNFQQIEDQFCNFSLEQEADLLSAVARLGYRLQSSSCSLCHPVEKHLHVFVRANDAALAEDLRDKVQALETLIGRETTCHKKESALWSQERSRLFTQMEELRERAEKAEKKLALAGEQAASQKLELNNIRNQITTNELMLSSKMEEFQKQTEAKYFAEVTELRERLAGATEEGNSIREKLQLAQTFAQMLEEYDVPSEHDGLAEKHVRISCPGVQEEHIVIEPLPNGVAVKINPSSAEDTPPVFAKEFQYPHSEGSFELSLDQCGLENGVLLLVLKRVQKSKFRLTRAGRSSLCPIAEDQESNSGAEVIAQNRTLSPSTSQISLGTTISSHWIGPDSDAKSDQSWALAPPQIDYDSELANPTMVTSAPPFTQPARCLLKDSLLLDENGERVSVMDLHRGARLCSLRSNEEGNLVFGVAIVSAIRLGMFRDTDIACIKLQRQDSEKQDNGKHLEMRVTTSHSVLVKTAASEFKDWIACPAGELQVGRHTLFVLESESDSCYDFVSLNTSVQTCEVVEIELEDKADAVMLHLGDGVFAGVFGSPPWPTMHVITKNASLDVQTISESKSLVTHSSSSDPTHDRQTEYPVYRQINPPHDAHCLARCKFYFTPQGCKKGKLCTLCHNPEHQAHASEQRTHRGVHKRR